MLEAGQYATVHDPGGVWYGQVVSPPKSPSTDYLIRFGGSDMVKTVPASIVGLHSAFASRRSPRLSAASNDRIERVANREKLMSNDTCTAVMSGVIKLLGVEKFAVVKAFDGSGPDGLYSLVANFGGDIHTAQHDAAGWEHGMVFQKCGGEVVFYQGWVGTFTLRDWLLLTPKCMSLASSKYSPRHPSFHPSIMGDYFRQLAGLQTLWDNTVKHDMDVSIFLAATEFVFGPKSSLCAMQLGAAKVKGARLNFHWKHHAFKP